MSESAHNDSSFQVPFYCHSCHRTFLSADPQCPHCQGDFVEAISDSIAVLAIDDAQSRGRLNSPPQSPTQPPIIQSIQDILRQHLSAHENALRANGVLTGDGASNEHDPDNHTRRQHNDMQRRVVAMVDRMFGGGPRAASSPTEQNEQSAQNGRNAHSEQSEQNAQQRTNTSPATEPDDRTPDDQTRTRTPDDANTRTIRIPWSGGNEAVVVVSSTSPLGGIFSSDIFSSDILPDTQHLANPQSILHPLLRLFGYAGDPRDYVNDPQRFADILDRLFQSSEGHTQPLSPAAISKLPRTKCTDPHLNCPVCMDSLCGDPAEASPSCIRLKCGHEFHEHCLVPWLQRCSTCPVCRGKEEDDKK